MSQLSDCSSWQHLMRSRRQCYHMIHHVTTRWPHDDHVMGTWLFCCVLFDKRGHGSPSANIHVLCLRHARDSMQSCWTTEQWFRLDMLPTFALIRVQTQSNLVCKSQYVKHNTWVKLIIKYVFNVFNYQPLVLGSILRADVGNTFHPLSHCLAALPY